MDPFVASVVTLDGRPGLFSCADASCQAAFLELDGVAALADGFHEVAVPSGVKAADGQELFATFRSSFLVHRGRDVIADPQMHEQPGLVCMDFGHLCHEASGAKWMRMQNVRQHSKWSEWLPYQNVSDWPVYPGIPVLVQYHAGSSSSYIVGDCVLADGMRCHASWHDEMFLRGDFNGWGDIQDGRMRRVGHFTWAANITLSRFSRAKFAPQKGWSKSYGVHPRRPLLYALPTFDPRFTNFQYDPLISGTDATRQWMVQKDFWSAEESMASGAEFASELWIGYQCTAEEPKCPVPSQDSNKWRCYGFSSSQDVARPSVNQPTLECAPGAQPEPEAMDAGEESAAVPESLEDGATVEETVAWSRARLSQAERELGAWSLEPPFETHETPGQSPKERRRRNFRVRLDKALETVARVLEASRQPKAAADVFHRYLDKFLLVEFLTNSALASQISCLQALGLTSAQLQMLRSWASENSVSLQFCAEERCKFLREESRDIEGSRRVEEVKVAGASIVETTTKVVTTVTEYVWSFSVQYELTAFRGVGAEADDRIVFRSRSGTSEIKTSGKVPPFPEVKVHKPDPVNVSFLLRSLREDAPQSAGFSIRRQDAKCRTPTRNSEVEASQKYFGQFRTWGEAIVHYLVEMCRKIDTKSFETSVTDEGIFQPVLPLLEDPNTRAIVQVPGSGDLIDLGSQDPDRGATLSLGDANRFLQEERRSLEAKFGELAQVFPQSDSVITAAEAQLVATTLHCCAVCRQYDESLRYVESMLRAQLLAAIGKSVSPKDFSDYMNFHNRKLFADAFAPQPFCFAVRRSELHSPEGTVSIEKGGEPVSTMVAQTEASWPMEFALNASSSVSFVGQHYLHAFLSHQFTTDLFGRSSKEAFQLVSRARQFSSMIVLVGRVVSSTTFDPKQAFIVQNKDELSIGLELSTIPTAREFRDAIESLSPEQQRFAKAIRSMQLESTLFGLVIVHIKPQLEKVLNLPNDSLTKEIKLTQDLMQLFIKFQIPSDLLSFSGPPEASETERLATVKGHVQAMQSMLSISQKEELVQNFAEKAFQEASDPFGSTGGGCHFDMDHLFGGVPAMGAPVPTGMPAMAMPMMQVPQHAPAPTTSLFGTSCSPFGSTGGGLFSFPSGTGGSIFGAQGGGGGGGSLFGNSGPSSFGGAAASVQEDHQRSCQQAQQAAPSRPAVQQPAPQPDEPMDTSTEAQDERLMTRDYTQLPVQLDQRFEKLQTGGALRAAILNLQDAWQKKSQQALLAQPSQTSIGVDEQKQEKLAAFELLDALTKSGALPLVNASLHVVVAAVHCFDKTVTETVIQDNMNPIENVERSALIMASTIHQQPVAALLRVSRNTEDLIDACRLRSKPGFEQHLPASFWLGSDGKPPTFGEAGLRRMPSPEDWNSEVVYSVMVDRFANGDITNDLHNIPHYQKQDLKSGEPWNLHQWRHGGDLLGILGRLSYMKHLGATVVALSPVFLNSGGEYHGYSISDLSKIDPGFGDAKLLQTLVAEAGLRLSVRLDVQVNHAVATGLAYRSVHMDPVSQVSNCVASFEEVYRNTSGGQPKRSHQRSLSFGVLPRHLHHQEYEACAFPVARSWWVSLSEAFVLRLKKAKAMPTGSFVSSRKEAMDHVAPRANAFRKFMAVCETVCLEFEREVREMSEDILMYRGELARCADLLAFQLGKEKQYHNMLENIAENTSVLIGKSSELGQKHDAHEPLREQMNQIMDVIMNTHKDVNAGHGAVHQDHRQMVESHLMTSAQLQNQAAAVQAELDNIMKVLNVPVVGYTKVECFIGWEKCTSRALTSSACEIDRAISWHVRWQSGEHGESGWDRWEEASGCISCTDHGRLWCKGGNHGSWNDELGEQRAAGLRKPGTPVSGPKESSLEEFQLGRYANLSICNRSTIPHPCSVRQVSTNLLKYWIAYADIDGLRLSSVGFMSADFTAYLSTHLRRYATKLGKEQFFMIGEVDLSDQPFGLQHVGTMSGAPPQRLPYQLKRAREELCPYYSGLRPATPGLMAAYPTAEVAHLRSVTSSKISPAEFFQSQIYLKAQEVQRDIANVADVRSAWTAAESYQLPRLLSVSTSPGDDDLHSWRILYASAWSLTWRGIPEIWYGAEFGFTGLCYANDAERKELLDRMVAAKISATVAEDLLQHCDYRAKGAGSVDRGFWRQDMFTGGPMELGRAAFDSQALPPSPVQLRARLMEAAPPHWCEEPMFDRTSQVFRYSRALIRIRRSCPGLRSATAVEAKAYGQASGEQIAFWKLLEQEDDKQAAAPLAMLIVLSISESPSAEPTRYTMPPGVAHQDGQAYVDLLHPSKMAVVDAQGNQSLLLVPGGLEAVHVSIFAPIETVDEEMGEQWLLCKGAELPPLEDVCQRSMFALILTASASVIGLAIPFIVLLLNCRSSVYLSIVKRPTRPEPISEFARLTPKHVLCAAIEHTIPIRNVKINAGGLGKVLDQMLREHPPCRLSLVHPKFGDVDYGELEEFTQLTLTVDGKDHVVIVYRLEDELNGITRS
ncbi:susA, partial [Symbiodinium sp. CCMP2456]